jgi:two-component system chemotaxis response regulator CheB
VLVVDDSALARRAISDALARDPEVEVVGSATDPYAARDEILALQPDVITLDLEMPRMDGLTFLKILQEHHPVPVVVVSSLTPSGSSKALEALQAGAVDVLAKPDGSGNLGQLAHQLAFHVKAAARSRRRAERLKAVADGAIPAAPSIRPGEFSSRRVILIGASTGGVEALRFLLPRLPNGLPPIVVVQHIPANFSHALANHLDDLCPFQVREAVDGEELRTGLCLVAPGDFHLAVQRRGAAPAFALSQEPPLHSHRPAADVLFRSIAEVYGARALGLVLTGMGQDGVKGCEDITGAGGRVIVQDEATSVVWEMAGLVAKAGLADAVMPLADLASELTRRTTRPTAVADGRGAA